MNTLSKPLYAAACVALMSAALPARSANIVTGSHDLGSISVPSAQGFARAFIDTDLLTAGLQLTGVPGTVLASDTFYEDYAFQIGGSTFNSITATIDLGSVLGISNLQTRLYQGSLLTTTTGTAGPALISAWSDSSLIASSGGSGDVQVIAPLNLAPGSYVFEVRGRIDGSVGGAYAGVLNFASPVPEPEAAWLALVGLILVRYATRSKRQVRHERANPALA